MGNEASLVEKILLLHRELDGAEIPHAFGGALALAWCTQQARGTIDIDINLFIEAREAESVLAKLPRGIEISHSARSAITSEGQARLWWDKTPVDVFFDTTEFHRAVARRVSTESFAGEQIPFLACRDIAVFKVFFNRTRDWADLEDMATAGTLDVEAVLGIIVNYLGVDDQRIERLRALRVR